MGLPSDGTDSCKVAVVLICLSCAQFQCEARVGMLRNYIPILPGTYRGCASGTACFTLLSVMLTTDWKVLRQGSFINKMVDLGWTAHDRFAGSGSSHEWNSIHVLVRSIARYHAFLDLMSTSVTFFVPTIASVREPHSDIATR